MVALTDEELNVLKGLWKTTAKTTPTTTNTTTTQTTQTNTTKSNVNNIVESLEWTDDNRFLSKWRFKNAWKKVGNWLDNAWHTITDRDDKNWIYDYSQFKEYNKQLKAAEDAGEEIDRDLFYKSMAEDGIIDYDKFKENYTEYEDQFAAYRKAMEDNKEEFSKKLDNSLSSAMSKAKDSYEINTITEAIKKMTDQRQMFVDSVMSTYKDTRDKSLVDYMNEVLDDYDNAIITFTTERARHLTEEDRKGWWAYYATLRDDSMKDLANSIVRIQNKAQNKMASAAIQDNFKDSWESFTKWNFISAAWELVWGVMNSVNWLLDKVWTVFEEWKQIVWWMYDVVEELNHLNTYADDASWFRKAFGTLGSWTMSIIDALPEIWPAIIDLIAWEKVGTISKIAKAAKNADKIVDVAKQASLIKNIVSKWRYKWLVKIWETAGKRYFSEVAKDILVYDVAFQQFEWHPLTTDEMTLNLIFNLPLDWISVALSRGAKYFKPELSKSILQSDTISYELKKKLEDWIRKWYSNKKLAEIYYMWKSIEDWQNIKNLINIKDWLETDEAELFKKIQEIQEESLSTWDRLSTFQWDLDDMLTEMESRISRKSRKSWSIDEQIDEWMKALFNKTWLSKALTTNLTVRSNIAAISNLIEKWILWEWDANILRAAINNAAWKNKQVADILYWMFTSDDDVLLQWLLKWKLDWNNVWDILAKTLYNLISADRKYLDWAEIINWWIRRDSNSFKNIFTWEIEHIKPWKMDESLKKIFWDSYSMSSIQTDRIIDWINMALNWQAVDWFYDVSNVFWNVNILKQGFNKWTPEYTLINNAFKWAWLKLSVDNWIYKITWRKKNLEKFATQANQLKNIKTLQWLDAWQLDTFKLMFLDEYVASFNKNMDFLRTKWLNDTEINKYAKNYKTWIDKLETPESLKKRQKIQSNMWVDTTNVLKIETQQMPKENQDNIADAINKWMNGQLSHDQVQTEIWSNLLQGKVIEAKVDVNGRIDEEDLWNQLMELMDDVISPSRKEMEDDLGTRNFTWETRDVKEWIIDDIQRPKEQIRDNLLWFIRAFGDVKADELKEFTKVMGTFLWVISQSPSALKALAQDEWTIFLRTIFSRMLTKNKAATTSYLTIWQRTYDNIVSRLSKNIDSFELNEFNRWFKQLTNKIEEAKLLIEKQWINLAQNSDLIRTLNKIQWLYDVADYNKWRNIITKWHKSKVIEDIYNSWKEFNISTMTAKDIEQLSRAMAIEQLNSIWYYSAKAFEDIKTWYEAWLNKLKVKNPWAKFKVSKWNFWYNFVSDEVTLWLHNANMLLWNIDNLDALSKISIWHEFEHQRIFNYKGKNYFIKDVDTKWLTNDEILERRARYNLENKELELLGWKVVDYIKWLKESLKNWLKDITPTEINQLYNTANTLFDDETFKQISDWLDINNIINKLIDINDKIALNRNVWYLDKNIMIAELLKDSSFSKLDELITEIWSMQQIIWAGYKWFDVIKLNELLDKAELTADTIDRFRNLFYDWTDRTAAEIRDALLTFYNKNDLIKPLTAKQVIEDKIMSWVMLLDNKVKKVSTWNRVVDALWSKGTNIKYNKGDLYNGKIPLWNKKLVFFDIETTGKIQGQWAWRIYPEVTQLSIKVMENWKAWKPISKIYNVSAEWLKQYEKTLAEWFDWIPLDKVKNAKWMIKDDKEVFWLMQSLAKEDNTIFVAHNWLQFDLPILNNLWLNLPENKVIDTLQLYKWVLPFEGVWKQEEIVKKTKNIKEAMDKFVKINKIPDELKQHNAEYDTAQLQYVFGYIYNHLLLNKKIDSNMTPDQILDVMQMISWRMQREATHVETGWNKKYVIYWGEERGKEFAQMLSERLKFADIATRWRTDAQIKDSIIKAFKQFNDEIQYTDYKNLIDKIQLEDTIKTLESMDDSEVVKFWEMLDAVEPHVPTKTYKNTRKTSSNVLKEKVVWDYINTNSVEWEVFYKDKDIVWWEDTKRLISEREETNKEVADILLDNKRWDSVDVAKTLRTMKGKLWEAWDKYLDILIDYAEKNWLSIDWNKLLITAKDIENFNEWNNWDFNIYVINKLFNVIWALWWWEKLQQLSRTWLDFNIYDFVSSRLSWWLISKDGTILNKDTSILKNTIKGFLNSIEDIVWKSSDEIDVQAIVNWMSASEIVEFNDALVRYIDLFKKWEAKHAEELENTIMNILANKVWGILYREWVEDVTWLAPDIEKQSFKKLKIKPQKWKANDTRTTQWLLEKLADIIWIKEADVKLDEADILGWYEDYTKLLKDIVNSEWELLDDAQVGAKYEDFIVNEWQYLLSYLYKADWVTEAQKKRIEQLMEDTAILKWIAHEEDMNTIKNLAEEYSYRYEDSSYMSKMSDDYREVMETDIKLFDKWEEQQINEWAKRFNMFNIVRNEKWKITWYELSKQFREQFDINIEKIFNQFEDMYSIEFDPVKYMTEWIDDTAKKLSINQWVFFNQAWLNDKKLTQLFETARYDRTLSKFLDYNRWRYSTNIVSSLNNGWIKSLGKWETVIVTFANWKQLKIADWEYKFDWNDLELMDSIFKSLNTRGWTSVKLTDWKTISNEEFIYAPTFWNSFVWTYAADKLWISSWLYNKKAITVGKTAEWKEIKEEIVWQAVEWNAALLEMYNKLIAWEDTYMRPLKDFEDEKEIERIKEIRNSQWPTVFRLEKEIANKLKGTAYEVWQKEYITTVERLKDFKFSFPPADRQAQRVVVKDTKWNVIKMFDSAEDEFTYLVKEWKWYKEVTDTPARISKWWDENTEWYFNRGNRTIIVRKNKKWDYVFVREEPLEWEWRVTHIVPEYLVYRRPYNSLYDEAVWWKHVDEMVEENIVEWNPRELDAAIDDIKNWRSDATFNDIRSITESEWQYTEAMPYYWDTMKIRIENDKWDDMRVELEKTQTYWPNWETYPAWNLYWETEWTSMWFSFNKDRWWNFDRVYKDIELDEDTLTPVRAMVQEVEEIEPWEYMGVRVDWHYNKWKRVTWIDDDNKAYHAAMRKVKWWRLENLSEKYWEKSEIKLESIRHFDWDSWISQLDKQLEDELKYAKWNKKAVKDLMNEKNANDIVKKVINEWSWDLPVEQANSMWRLWRAIYSLTNKWLIRDDKTIRQVVWERDTFIQFNGKKLNELTNKWNDLMRNRSSEEQDRIIEAYQKQVSSAMKNNPDKALTFIDISNIDSEADEILNEFTKTMAYNWRWKNLWILRMMNKPRAMSDIMWKLQNTNLIAYMWKTWWTKQDAFEFAVRSANLQWITDPKRLKAIWQDFVWDPLAVWVRQNALANLRSVNRFLKYSVPAPVSWTVMLLNGTLLWEQMYRAKKKWLSWFMDNEAFEKIVLNEKVLTLFDRWEDILLHGNTDMDINMLAFDKWLKNIADALTKEWTKWRKLAETIMLWWIHSIQDLTYNARVRVLAFAQALQQKWVTELQLDDILRKVESWEMWTNQKYLNAWNDIMAMTEYYYDDFFTNSATAFMSRNKYSRLFIFNNLQWYVIKRTDEIGRAITGFKNWLAAKPKWVHYNWWDFIDHLEQNQELKAFLNNVILSTKLAYYFNRADQIDWGDWDNFARYAIEANDYLSSVPATFFYQLLTSPIAWYNKYREWADVTWEDKNFADGTSVVLMNILSQVCSQFFRESKPLAALVDSAVSFAKTWDIWFAWSVLGTDLEKISNWLWRFWLIDWIEKYWLEDFGSDHDIIWQILLAWDKTSPIWKSIQDSYDVTFVDNVLNDSWYAFVSALWNLPLVWELIKNVSDSGWYSFNEAKVKRLSDMMDNDKNLRNIMFGNFDYGVFKDHPDAISRIYNDFVSFNYTNEQLKSPGKHWVWYFVEWKDTTLDSMKEDVFVKNICDKLWMTIEQFHQYITQWSREDYNIKWDKTAKTVAILKMIAAADAAEPGSWKIILSYMAANRLYELEKWATWLDYPKTADLTEDELTRLKAQVISEFAPEMYVADRTNQYKVMREYISIADPKVFNSLKSDNTLKWYANSIGFLDMLTYQAAKDWDVNAKYFKNVFSLTGKYMKNDANRLALMRHVMSTIDETDLDISAKMIAKEWVLSWNIDVYNRCKEDPYFRAMYPGAMEDFEHRIWWIWDYLNIAWSDYWYWYGKGKNKYKNNYPNYSNYSNYNPQNQQVHDDFVKQTSPFVNPFSDQYIPRENGYKLWTPKGYKTTQWPLDYYRKVYEAHIKAYTDKLVKPRDDWKKNKGSWYQNYDWQYKYWEWFRNRGYVNPARLVFPRHKQPAYSTKVLANMPGASG